MSTRNIIHGTSSLGFAWFWPWLNFLNLSMHSKSLSVSWLLFSFCEISSLLFSSHKTVLLILHGGGVKWLAQVVISSHCKPGKISSASP